MFSKRNLLRIALLAAASFAASSAQAVYHHGRPDKVHARNPSHRVHSHATPPQRWVPIGPPRVSASARTDYGVRRHARRYESFGVGQVAEPSGGDTGFWHWPSRLATSVFGVGQAAQPVPYPDEEPWHARAVVPTTVYREQVRSYVVPVQTYRTVHRTRYVPVTTTVHVPVTSYQTVERVERVPARAYRHYDPACRCSY